MKKLLTLILSLIPVLLFAQELTADTPAVAAGIDWSAELLKIVLSVLGMVLMRVAAQAIPLLNAWLKQVMHFRGSAVVADALTQAIAEMGDELQKALADGRIDAAEKAALMLKARTIAADKLQRMSGFYKADLIGWIDDQLNIALAKILARISV